MHVQQNLHINVVLDITVGVLVVRDSTTCGKTSLENKQRFLSRQALIDGNDASVIGRWLTSFT